MSDTSIAENTPENEPVPTNRLAPAVAPTARRSPAWTHTIATRMFLISIFCIPVQLEIASFRAVAGSRLPPGDFFLAFSLILAPASFRIMRKPLGYLPLALPLVLGYGAIVSLVLQARLTGHSVNVKLIGSFVLVVLGTLTLAYARAGYTPRIMRSFLYGVGFWGVIGYIDWRIVDIFPWLKVDIASRFGALQFDPNNAGATFAVALLLSWRYGHRLFERRWVWIALTIWFATGLSLTLSRGAYIGTAAAVLTVVAIDRVSVDRWARYLAGIIVIAAFLTATGFVDTAVNDFTRRPDTVGSRNDFADYAVDRWVDSRGLGMGLGTFRAETTRIVHNTAIWLVVEMSLPGLLFFIAMVVLPFQACLRMRTYDHELALALLAAHTAMVVASVGIEALYQRTWWVIIGMTMLPAASVRAEQIAAVLGQSSDAEAKGDTGDGDTRMLDVAPD